MSALPLSGLDRFLAAVATTNPADVTSQVESLQTELNSLRQEIATLHKRDLTLKEYMFRLDEELRLAARLQQDFLPKTMPKVGPVRFQSLFRPAGYVSGDIYDVMRLDEKHVGFYIADAVGHGMPAALLTMFLKNALVTKEIIPGGYRLLAPGEALGRLNASLVEQNLSQATFATAIYGMINTETLHVRYASAGHPAALLMPAGGGTQTLENTGGILGIFAHANFTDGSAQLSPGDRMVVYSDGVEVAFAEDQKSGTRQWQTRLEETRHLPVETVLKEFSDHIDHESAGAELKDDLSMIVVEIVSE